MTTLIRELLGKRRRVVLILLMAAASLVSLLVLAWRVYFTETPFYLFLVWNLFLAWIPFGASLLAYDLHRKGEARSYMLIGVGLFWLLFFPNAPYITSDLVHLHNYPDDSLAFMYWFDMIMISCFAWCGLLLGFVSMYLMQTIVRERTRPLFGWIFACGAFAAAGFGVYLGRFQRWNSWDLINQPVGLASDILGTILHPFAHASAWKITILFAVMMLMIYGVLYGFVEHARERKSVDPETEGALGN